MGVINVASYFNYSIGYSGQTKNGNIFARGYFDPSYFTKKLSMLSGSLEWLPDVVPALSFTQYFTIEYATPNITEAEWNIITSMINNQAGNRKIKESITSQINDLYGPLLKQHLNHEDLISSQNITYKYRNINLTFTNLPK
jgi:hypothetical protein